MKHTVIYIEQICKTTHECHLKGIATEEQLDIIAEKIEKASHPDDAVDIIASVGLEVELYDGEGCWEGSDFEYRDDCEAD